MYYYLGVLCVLCGQKLIREVQRCKFALVFFCGFVVCFCGFDFIVERADELAPAGIAYLDFPFLCSFLEAHSFIF